MAKPSPVRIATVADEPEIIRLLHIMHGESGFHSLDVGVAREVFSRAFQRKGGIIGVIGDKDDIEAMIYVLICRHWYTKENHLEELFNFVRPDRRKSDHARTLIGFAKQCSDEIKIPLLIGVMTNKRVAAKVRLYRKALGFPAGAVWVYNAKWVNESVPDNEEFWRAPFPAHSSRKNGRHESDKQFALGLSKEG